jgi:hypothetical protein
VFKTILGSDATLPRGMTTRRAEESDAAREVWILMSDLVLDNERRRQVAETLGISFGRARTVRRVARRPMSMRELESHLAQTTCAGWPASDCAAATSSARPCSIPAARTSISEVVS